MLQRSCDTSDLLDSKLRNLQVLIFSSLYYTSTSGQFPYTFYLKNCKTFIRGDNIEKGTWIDACDSKDLRRLIFPNDRLFQLVLKGVNT